jgi:DNA-binding MurR/RpiR family transcriptional regulator
MPAPEEGTLAERLLAAYPSLTESEQRVAGFIMDRPGELAAFAGKELAEQAGVSGATVSRLFRRLGYDSYEAARREARALRSAGSPLHLLDSRSAHGPTLIAQHLAEETHLVEVTLSMLSPLVVQEVASALAEARHVWFAGFRNSRFLADYARALFTSFRSDAHSLAPSGQTLAEGVASVAPGDIVLAFGMRRRLTSFVPLLDAISAQGADILLVTDRSVKASLTGVRWTLLCAVETARPIDSYAGVLALTRLLALETLRELGPRSRRRLARVEAVQLQLRELE